MCWHRIISKGECCSPDIPEAFAATIFHDANTRMRTWIYVRSASNTSVSSVKHEGQALNVSLTEEDGPDGKKSIVHCVGWQSWSRTFVKGQMSNARDKGSRLNWRNGKGLEEIKGD